MLYVPVPGHEAGYWQLGNYSHPGLHLVLGPQLRLQPFGRPREQPAQLPSPTLSFPSREPRWALIYLQTTQGLKSLLGECF